MAEEILSKKCSKCKQIKPLSEFQKRSQPKDGFESRCKTCRAEYRKSPRGRLVFRHASRKYRQSEKGKAKQKRYKQSEKGKATQNRYNQSEKGKIMRAKALKKYRQSEKGRIANRKYKTKLAERTDGKIIKNLREEKIQKLRKSTRDYDKITEQRNRRHTSRVLRSLLDYVRDQAKDRTPGFFRSQKTCELLVEFLMLRLSRQQIGDLNIEDMPCFHHEPHIVIRNPKTLQPKELFIERPLENKINAYYHEFRRDAGRTAPFLATQSGKKLLYSGLNRRLHVIGGKLNIEFLSPGSIRRTLVGEQTNNKKKEIVLALPLTKFVAKHVVVPKDAQGKPDKDEVADIKALITNAHKRRILKPTLPEPIGGWGRQRHKYNFKVTQMRKRWPRWRRISGLEELPPLISIRKVNKNLS